MLTNKFSISLILEFILKNICLSFVLIYRYILKPLIGNRASCRFNPSCSEYALQSLRKYSTFKAVKLIVIRLSKCHPYGPHGYDPVPAKSLEKSV